MGRVRGPWPSGRGPATEAKGTTMAGNDLGGLLGGLLGGGGQQGAGTSGGGASAGGANILGALLGALMSKNGGGNPLGGLLDGLTKAGLTEQAQSWVGPGENQAVTGEQVRQALPDDALQQAAQDAGVSPDQAADEIAQSLPQVVDKLTPDGQVPTESLEEIIKAQQL
ncbi:YidB family protein [Streptomyces sp. NPDC059063]|uniref:YidB family protein n=1 Tax=unclassified Streptomyces TaxID=2593676 RepID=UPI0036BFC2B0